MWRRHRRDNGDFKKKDFTTQWQWHRLGAVEVEMMVVVVETADLGTWMMLQTLGTEDEDEEFKRQRMQSQGSARPPGYWHRGRGQGTKVDTETGEEVGTVAMEQGVPT